MKLLRPERSRLLVEAQSKGRFANKLMFACGPRFDCVPRSARLSAQRE